MSMTPRQAFKFGFLLRCADENLSDVQTTDRVKYAMDRLNWDGKTMLPIDQQVVESTLDAWQKQAYDPIGGIGKGIGGLASLAKNLGFWGLLGGAGLGAGGGYLAAKMTDKDVDLEEMKQQELIAAYKQQAERIRRQMAARSYRPSKTPRAPKLVA